MLKIEKINFVEEFNKIMDIANSPGNADFLLKEMLANKINEVIDSLDQHDHKFIPHGHGGAYPWSGDRLP